MAVTTQQIIDAYRQTVGAGLMSEAEFVRRATTEFGVTPEQLTAARAQLTGNGPVPGWDPAALTVKSYGEQADTDMPVAKAYGEYFYQKTSSDPNSPVVRYRPGQVGAGQTYEFVDPKTGAPTGQTGQFKENSNLLQMVGQTVKDFAPLIIAAAGANYLGPGINELLGAGTGVGSTVGMTGAEAATGMLGGEALGTAAGAGAGAAAGAGAGAAAAGGVDISKLLGNLGKSITEGNIWSALVPTLTSVLGAGTAASSAKEAASITAEATKEAARLQKEAASEATALNKKIYEDTAARYKPFEEAGKFALGELEGRVKGLPGYEQIPEAFKYKGALPEDFTYDINKLPKYDYEGKVPEKFTYGGTQPAYEYDGEVPKFTYEGKVPEKFTYGGTAPTYAYEREIPEFNYEGKQPEAFKFRSEDLALDPGYAFRLAEGQKALERSAAAKGGLMSGATGKALLRYGQDMGSQEFANAYARAMSSYNALREAELEKYARSRGEFDIRRAKEADLYSRGLTEYDIKKAEDETRYGRDKTAYELEREREADLYKRGVAEYDISREREADLYKRGLAKYDIEAAREAEDYRRKFGEYGAEVAREEALYSRGLTKYEMDKAREAAEYSRLLGEYGLKRERESDLYNRELTEYNAARMREAEKYNRLAGLAGIGASTTNALTSAGERYGSGTNAIGLSLAANLNALNLANAGTAGGAAIAKGTAYGGALNRLSEMFGRYTNRGTSSSPYAYGGSAGTGFGTGSMFGNEDLGQYYSDMRLKTNIKRIGVRADGLGVYEFNYVWGGPRQVGLMAQEVINVYPDAVSEVDGYLMVDYAKV